MVAMSQLPYRGSTEVSVLKEEGGVHISRKLGEMQFQLRVEGLSVCPWLDRPSSLPVTLQPGLSSSGEVCQGWGGGSGDLELGRVGRVPLVGSKD